MPDYGPSTYGDRIAGVYDAWPGLPGDADAAVGFLAGLAGSGPALELGIGTGRIALPLSERGVEVHGIDASEEMLERLRTKKGSERIPVAAGDFADVPIEGSYRVVYVAFNTLFALLTQEDQVRCFANVASHLTDDGVFVIQAFVPDLSRFDRGQRTNTLASEVDSVRFDASVYDPVTQVVKTNHVVIEPGGIRMFPVQLRFAFPSELDLMARLAGMRLKERFAGWGREPFTADSGQHVSVYEQAG